MHTILAGKPEGKGLVLRPRGRWEDNTEMDFKDAWWGDCRVQWRTLEFCSGKGSTNSVEDRGQRERGSGDGSPLVRGTGGSCNLVQEISFHIVKFSKFLVL